MNKVYLLTGGNIGDRVAYLSKAKSAIESYCGKIIASSSIYETAAWGKENQAAFLNQVLVIETRFSPEKLMHLILDIELEMGRKRAEKYGPRTIDIDILLIDNEIINTPFLVVPHPQLQNRRFVLTPLLELAPQLVHPIIQQTIEALFANCPDDLNVKKFSDSK
jgi:2-amino-4-hydroxy-6-hydroxymethyldihydropteridine diphosphokinase